MMVYMNIIFCDFFFFGISNNYMVSNNCVIYIKFGIKFVYIYVLFFDIM